MNLFNNKYGGYDLDIRGEIIIPIGCKEKHNKINKLSIFKIADTKTLRKFLEENPILEKTITETTYTDKNEYFFLFATNNDKQPKVLLCLKDEEATKIFSQPNTRILKHLLSISYSKNIIFGKCTSAMVTITEDQGRISPGPEYCDGAMTTNLQNYDQTQRHADLIIGRLRSR